MGKIEPEKEIKKWLFAMRRKEKRKTRGGMFVKEKEIRDDGVRWKS